MNIEQGMSLNDLMEMAQKSKEHKQLFTGLALLDQTVQTLAKAVIESKVQDVREYYIKTEIMNQCYSLYIFNAVKQVTIGVSWTLADFLMQCQDKRIEITLEKNVQRMLDKFEEKGLSTTRTNWLI